MDTAPIAQPSNGYGIVWEGQTPRVAKEQGMANIVVSEANSKHDEVWKPRVITLFYSSEWSAGTNRNLDATIRLGNEGK